MQIKCGGANIPAVASYEIPNRIGTNSVQHFWLELVQEPG